MPGLAFITPVLAVTGHSLLILFLAALLGAALGLARPVRREIVPRGKLRPAIEHALEHKGVTCELLGSSAHELHYEVTVPFEEKIRTLTRLIRGLDDRHGTSVEWDIKKQKLVKR